MKLYGTWVGAGLLALASAAGGPTMESREAKGTFDVKVTPVTEDTHLGVASGHLTIAKTFQGDLAGTSRADMWTADTAVQGSAGYIAIEKVEGALHGRRGNFTLVHRGTMRKGGEFDLTVVVVPDSGTGELAGLAGRMTITVAGGAHSYTFEYRLPAAHGGEATPPPR